LATRNPSQAAMADCAEVSSGNSTTALFAGIGSIVLLLACACVLRLHSRSNKLQRERDWQITERLHAAIKTTKKLSFPATFVPASSFIEQGKLMSYEELRDEKQHVVKDTFLELVMTKQYVVFLSQ
jgi:hypothetical protein